MLISQKDILFLTRQLSPHRPRRLRMTRVGRDFDGGYVICDDVLNYSTAISIGIGDDVSFDFALASNGVRVMQFDHTVDNPPHAHPLFTFVKRKWDERTGDNNVCLADINTLRDTHGPGEALLKFDIEGDEWTNLGLIQPCDLACYRQIVCELHGLIRLSEPSFYEAVHRALTTLLANHCVIHAHVNNYGSIGLVSGVVIPDVVEVTLLRRDVDDLVFYPGPLPCDLDRPNCPSQPDIFFPFVF
jgi:hypothetical protein